MEVKNGDIFMARVPLQELLHEPWPVKTAFALAKLARKLDGPYKDIDTVRNKLILQYGEQNEKGQAQVRQDSEHWPDFVAAFNELMDHSVKLVIEPVALPSDNGMYVKPETLMALEQFVDVA